MADRQLRNGTLVNRLDKQSGPSISINKPDRQLRASTIAARNEQQPLIKKRKSKARSEPSGSSADVDIAKHQPLAKKARASQVHYLCTTCYEELPAKLLPDQNPSAKCEHLINTCTKCLQTWLKVQVTSGNFTSIGDVMKHLAIKCPECPELMVNSDIRSAARLPSYRRFDELDRRHIAEHTPDWRWCLSPTCRAGQVHKTPSRSQISNIVKTLTKDLVQDDPRICICHECGSTACVVCDRPWHEGETCREFHARVKDRMDEEDKAIARINRLTRKCPTCKTKIEKNGGCPHMTCTRCSVAFCWNCLGTYEKGHCHCTSPRP